MEAMKGGCVCVYHMTKMVSFISVISFLSFFMFTAAVFRDEAHENYVT